MRLGNGKWETAKFNNRLQVEELGLGSSASNAGTWKVNYEFGEYDPNTQTVTGSKNTGNIARQTISFDGLPNAYVQTYQYDSLYRLTNANEKAGTTENWSEAFTYDRYGNRDKKYRDGVEITNNALSHPTIDQNTNRFTSAGYGYDKVGNLITDAEGRTFTFDGNNKQRFITDGNNATVGEYFYDGDGMRVKKHVYSGGTLSKTVIFVYSGGKLVEEYSSETPPTEKKIKYMTEDHLGTPRVITDGSGAVVSRRDFMPFGEDLGSTVGTRSTSSFKYASQDDDVRQKFTGYQKDEETQLDFAEARMYENRHARFTAVDPLLASGNSANPQTFNRFVYVGNNPINITDPLGLDWYFSEKNNNYRWFDDKADDGYKKVDFGGNSSYSYQACVFEDCSIKATHFLWDDGSNSWDSQSYLDAIIFAPTLDGFRQFDNDLKTGGRIGFGNFFRSIPNCLVECNFLGLPVDVPGNDLHDSIPGGLSLEKLGVSSFFEYEKPANRTQMFASGATQLTLGALTTKGVGTASTLIPQIPRVVNNLRSVKGVSQFRPNGSVNTLIDGGQFGINAKTLVVSESHFKDIKNVFKNYDSTRNVFRRNYWKHVLPHRHVYKLPVAPTKFNVNWRKTWVKNGATKNTVFRWEGIK